MQFLSIMFILSLLGIGMECFFTGLADARHHWTIRKTEGYSSVWYTPCYAWSALIFVLIGENSLKLFAWQWWSRGLIYLILIYISEFVSMWALREKHGASPSEENYYKSKWNIKGLIRLDFAPAWFFAGLYFETNYKILENTPTLKMHMWMILSTLALLYMIVGLGIECTMVAFKEKINGQAKDPHLMGRGKLLHMPLYGAAGFLFSFLPYFFST